MISDAAIRAASTWLAKQQADAPYEIVRDFYVRNLRGLRDSKPGEGIADIMPLDGGKVAIVSISPDGRVEGMTPEDSAAFVALYPPTEDTLTP